MLRRRKSSPEHRILEACTQSCRRIGISNARFVVAVSGGPDSLSLADLLYRLSGDLKLELVLTYVDHRLRGRRASEAERRAVSRFASERGLPLDIRELSTAAVIDCREGLEAAARGQRYAMLADSVFKYDAAGLVLAHHMTDQAETLLMRLVSGTTVEGAAAMRERSEREGVAILRPLLDVDGQDLRRYAKVRRLKPVFDRTNRDRRRLRSRIRMDLLPVVGRIRPGALRAIARTAASMAEEADALDAAVSELDPFDIDTRAQAPSPALRADREAFFALAPALRLRSLHRVVASVSDRPDYRVPRRFFLPLLGCDTFLPRTRVCVGYGVELCLDSHWLSVRRPNVVPAAQTQYLPLMDSEGRIVRGTLPEPFVDVQAVVVSEIDCLDVDAAAVSGGQHEGMDEDTGVRGVEARLRCVPPVRVRPATPGDGTAFGFTRSAFKREMQRDGRARVVLADNTGNRALLVRHPAGFIELFEGASAPEGRSTCLGLIAERAIRRGGLDEHGPAE